jgi:hypothetical protein
MIIIQEIEEYVSKKSTHSFRVNRLATSLALYFSIVPPRLNFFLKTTYIQLVYTRLDNQGSPKSHLT